MVLFSEIYEYALHVSAKLAVVKCQHYKMVRTRLLNFDGQFKEAEAL
jgi:hypothetical protein